MNGRSDETRDGAGVFHTNREPAEREHGSSKRRGGVFRGNRSLTITLLDIALVLLMFLIYMFFLAPDDEPARVEVGGYLLGASGFVFEGNVYATVVVQAADESSPREGADSLVRVTYPDGTTITDVLPSRSDFPTTIRHTFGEAVLDGNHAAAPQAQGGGGDGGRAEGAAADGAIPLTVEIAGESRRVELDLEYEPSDQ